MALWHYWPRRFLDGWSEGTVDSCHAAARAPAADGPFEDFSHARINIEFLIEAADLLGVVEPIDVDAIGDNLEVADRRFARFIGGEVDRHPASYAYLPPLPMAAAKTLQST